MLFGFCIPEGFEEFTSFFILKGDFIYVRYCWIYRRQGGNAGFDSWFEEIGVQGI
jgi:hypothetical protein